MKEWIVTEKTELLEYLYIVLKEYPKKKIKSFLSHGNILVNNKVQTQFNLQLKANDNVRMILGKTMYNKKNRNSISIIYEDNDFIVIDKPYGLLSVATDKEKERTAYHLVREHLNSTSHDKLFILHRLDKDTSGVLVFVKSEKLQLSLQENWNDIVTKREYIVMVEGALEHKSGSVENYLAENNSKFVYSTTSPQKGKKAITDYSVRKVRNGYSLLTVNIKTGRKNQIRVHMSDLGCPIVGDKKYGASTNNIKRLGLHASKLEFINPETNKKLKFEAPMPTIFKKFFNL